MSLGLIIFWFFILKNIFNNKLKKSRGTEDSNKSESAVEIQYNWLEKKYEFMFGDFKDRSPHQFFFAYWMIGFDAAYILLIFSLQKVPVLQCLSIFVLVLAFVICSAITRPFKKKTSAFLHFLNFSSVLVVAFLNLILAIIDDLNSDFSGRETQGKVITVVIILNIGTNALFSAGGMLLEIYKKFSKKCKKVSETNQKGQSSEGQNGDEKIFPSANNSDNSNLPRIRNESLIQVSVFHNQTVDLNNSRADLINNSIHRRPTIPSRRRIKRQTLQDNSKRRNKSLSSDQGSVFQDQSVNITIPQPNPITTSIHQPTIIPSGRTIKRITLEVQENH
jgi:hypothetical protein